MRYFIQVVDLSQGYIRLQNARLPQHILRVNEDGHINGNGTLNEQETVFQLSKNDFTFNPIVPGLAAAAILYHVRISAYRIF